MKDKKTCLVTGGAKRIGKFICTELAKDGWNVAIHYNTSDHESKVLEKEINKIGRNSIRIQADFNTFTADLMFLDFIKHVEKKLGPISLLVNNAAVFGFDSPCSTTLDQMKYHLSNNLIVPTMLTKALYQVKKIDKSNQISSAVINLLDQKLWNTNPDFFSYTLSKSALNEATKLMAKSFAPYLRVLGIAPGITLPIKDQNEGDFENAHRKTPLQRSSTPFDIADAVVWLAKARAITGTTLIIDGGQHLIPSSRDVVFMKS
jgi:NAD(P)-dependent dehydrogenase (short-subunit alcohol dehydrogenase family)